MPDTTTTTTTTTSTTPTPTTTTTTPAPEVCFPMTVALAGYWDLTDSNLGGGAYVTFRQKRYSGGYVVTDDVNLAARSNYFRSSQSVRILFEVETLTRNITNTVIGAPNTVAVIKSLDSQLQNTLDQFASTGSLQGTRGMGYDFTLSSGVTNSLLTTVAVNMWIKPVNQIHRIDTQITVGY